MSEETRTVEENLDEESTASAQAEDSSQEPVADASTDTEADVAEKNVAEKSEEKVDKAEQATAESDEVQQADSAKPAQTKRSTGASRSDTSEEKQSEEKQIVRLSVGQEIEGRVKRTTDFGAFVDIGAGRDGLVHISEMAVGRVNKVTDVVNEGDEVTVWIKKLDRKRNRISLTLIPPGTKTIKDLKEGEIVEGTVSKIVPYGAFVDIGVGTDALLHIREMSTGYVEKPEDVVKEGEKIEVRLTSVNRRRRRIDLSLKGLQEAPAETVGTTIDSSTEGETRQDQFENVEVLSPMELAFKKAMEAEGVEIDVKKKKKRGRKKSRSIQNEIIERTLDTVRK